MAGVQIPTIRTGERYERWQGDGPRETPPDTVLHVPDGVGGS
jgi:hypothetical protein